MKFYLTLILILVYSSSFAQQVFSINGTIRDKKGETLPGASLYLSGYQRSTLANENGQFRLDGLAPGNYDLLVKMVGFAPYSQNVVISNKTVTIDIVLEESAIALNEVVVKDDPDREYHLQLFRESFIGVSENALQCRILNTNVLNTHFDREERILTVRASQFLVIENKTLGYRINYLLHNFEYDFANSTVFFAGFPHYEEMKGSAARQKRWAQERLKAYNGSSQHFFNSLFNKTAEKEGFILYKKVMIPDKTRPDDSTINANIARLSKSVRTDDKGNFVIGNDSLSYWHSKRRQPKYTAFLDQRNVLTDTLVQVQNENIRRINFTDALFVMYTKEKESALFLNRRGLSLQRPMSMASYQASVVNMLVAPIYFYRNGGVYNPRSILYEGYWGWEKMADTLPLDYVRPR